MGLCRPVVRPRYAILPAYSSDLRLPCLLATGPLLWVSKIQTEIAISTINYEIVAFSHSVIDLIPFNNLIKEVIDNLVIDSDNMKFLSRSNVYEGNNSTIVVKTSLRVTPTSRHISVKFHWFWQHVVKVICDLEDQVRKLEGIYFHQWFTR